MKYKVNYKAMLVRNDGFSLVELLVVMAIFVGMLALISSTFSTILKQSSQQTRQAETQIERIVSSELLRLDIQNAGFGLPWAFQNSISYQEAAPNITVCAGGNYAGANPSSYNDSTSGVPRAIVAGYRICMNGSDYLAIKATSVGTTNTAQQWSYITAAGNAPAWGGSTNSLVTVIEPLAGTTVKQLVMNVSTFFTNYPANGSAANAFPSSFVPKNSMEIYMVYGVDPGSQISTLRFPFNRADYFISGLNKPSQCAPNTGVLVKAAVSQADGSLTMLPILECVADMRVIYQLDMNDDGTIGTQYDGLTASSNEGASISTVSATLNDASLLRQRLKEVRVYILAHEGRADSSYTFPSSTIDMTTGDAGTYGLGNATINLSSMIGTGWQNYRWKIIKLVVRPQNLM